MARLRNRYLAFILAVPILLAAWGSSFAKPCLMDDSVASHCCDGLATCGSSCGIGCQSMAEPERPAHPLIFSDGIAAQPDATRRLAGIEIAPDVPPPR